MLQLVFALSAAFYLVVGAVLYFLPQSGAFGVTVSPLWLARVAGAVLLAWGLQLAISSTRPSGAFLGGLVAGNLLVAATLVPAVLSGLGLFGSLPAAVPLGASVLLVVLALLALVLPRQGSRL